MNHQRLPYSCKAVDKGKRRGFGPPYPSQLTTARLGHPELRNSEHHSLERRGGLYKEFSRGGRFKLIRPYHQATRSHLPLHKQYCNSYVRVCARSNQGYTGLAKPVYPSSLPARRASRSHTYAGLGTREDVHLYDIWSSKEPPGLTVCWFQ